MIIKLNTETREISEHLESYEMHMDSAEEAQLKVDAATVVVLEMVKLAESGYTNKELQKLYIDILASYAKRLIDPDSEISTIDIYEKLTKIKNSVK